MKIDFFLMGRKGLRVLEHVCRSPHRRMLNCVVTAKDSGMQEDCADAIASVCKANGIVFFERNAYKAAPGVDYRILAGWKWMVTAPGTIVLHDALLPAYRGFAPLVNALINGEKEVGATAIWAAERYDTGPVIARESVPVTAPLRINDALDMMAGLYVNIIGGILADLAGGGLPAAIPQDETMASYSLWRDEDDYFINWSEDSNRIWRSIYALSFPYKGARTLLNGHTIIIEDAVPVNDVTIMNRQAGKVIFIEDGLPVVVCGNGLLKIISAVDGKGQSVLPLTKFRSRFFSPI